MSSRGQKTEVTRDKNRTARRGLDKVFHQLARFFNGIHWAVGITTLPAKATPREEMSFVLMWLGIIVFVIVFFVVFIYLLG